MKSKSIFFVPVILIILQLLLVLIGCQDFNNPKQATININLDLSKLIKESRSQTTQGSSEYILKILAYDATLYKTGGNIEKLPLLIQTENKVDTNGIVKTRLNLEIGLNVIFVAKLFKDENENPSYAGNSEIVKIEPQDNKVNLVLKKVQGDVDFDFSIHEHTFAEEWSMDETYHWKWSTCGHDVIGEKAEHKYTNGVCVCGFKNFVLIPAGIFQMGSSISGDHGGLVHSVTITRPFYMSKYEVTQAEYEQYCSYGESLPSEDYSVGHNYPAYYVSWYDTIVYCNNRSIAEGLTPCYSIFESTDPREWGPVPTSSDETWETITCDWNANGYRLPTEAEWEYAARAGENIIDKLTYSGTSDENQLVDYAWYKSNSERKTHKVGEKHSNSFGLYDMSGNVWEFCWNFYTSTYDETIEGGVDPTGAISGVSRIARGGDFKGSSVNCSVTYRFSTTLGKRYYYVGFRVVRSAE